MSQFTTWPSIGKLHDAQSSALRARLPRVTYRAKVKLHGTNAAIRVDADGTVTAQSRTKDLTPGKDTDNFGFAAWVDAVVPCITRRAKDYVLFGEWYGCGVQKGVALAQLTTKHFAVFAALYDGQLLVCPVAIAGLVGGQWCDVLNWVRGADNTYVFDFSSDTTNELVVARLNAEVEAIDKECPWALAVHGLRGPGEGVVLFPELPDEDLILETFARLSFKAKGESHRTSGKSAASLRAPASGDVVDFVNSVLTPARLDQGVSELLQLGVPRGAANTSQFLKWIGNDVQRECAGELEASSLDWKAVSKILAGRAAKWWNAA